MSEISTKRKNLKKELYTPPAFFIWPTSNMSADGTKQPIKREHLVSARQHQTSIDHPGARIQ